jgi:DNA-binding PadR family transcriptional regulator
MSKQWWAGMFPGGQPWDPFGWGQSPPRFFEAGEVRMAILSLLSEGPKHGYQLMKEMTERSGGLYKASAGSVYPTLQQLEDEELVTSDQQAGRRVYRITAAGRRELQKDPERVERIWKRAESWEDWGQNWSPDSALVFHAFGGVIKAGMRAVRRAGPEPVRHILERARKQLEEL